MSCSGWLRIWNVFTPHPIFFVASGCALFRHCSTTANSYSFMSWFTVMLFRIQEKYLIMSSGDANSLGPRVTGTHSFFSFFASGAASTASSALRFSPTSATGTSATTGTSSSGFVSSSAIVRGGDCRNTRKGARDE